MNFTLYSLFCLTAMTTVASPGPGVLMTIMKSLQHGYRGAIWTICGTATGAIIMASLSATGLGILLATSPTAYEGLRIVGACYMIYLGVKNWRTKPVSFRAAANIAQKDHDPAFDGMKNSTEIKRIPFFFEGIYLQMTNPMLIMFFISLFPQFIDKSYDFLLQFVVLSFTYFAFIIIIHSGYSFVITRFRDLLSDPKKTSIIYKVGGSIFILLALNVLQGVIKAHLF